MTIRKPTADKTDCDGGRRQAIRLWPGRRTAAVALVAASLIVLAGCSQSGDGPGQTGLGTTLPPADTTTSTSVVGTVPITPLRRGPVVDEDFSQRGQWEQKDDEQVAMGTVDGEYRILVKRTGGQLWMAPAPTTAPQGGDIRVEADAVAVSKVFGTFGVSCRVGAPGPGGRPRYLGVIATNGLWRIWRYDARPGEPVKNLGPPTPGFTPAISAAGPNRVALECLGRDDPGAPVTLRLYVNDVKVAEVTDAEGLPAGTVGLTVMSNAEPIEVRFDNLRATRL